jgi:hypothetical protein
MFSLSNKHFTKSLLAGVFLLFCVNIAISANYNSGKTRKKSSSRNHMAFHLHNRTLNMSLNNGFQFKGSSNFFKHQQNRVSVDLNSIYFQKGNNIYVVPMKQKSVILGKFKTPQRAFY